MRFLKHLYVQVILAIIVGVILGHYEAALAVKFKPLADGFIALVKMLIPPVIFLALVSGILSVNQASKVGKVGGFALVYFILMTTFALVVGVVVSYVFKPGSGFSVDVSTLNISTVSSYIDATQHQEGVVGFLLHIIPKTFVSAFVDGNILQIVFIALLFAFALSALAPDKRVLVGPLNALNNVIFKIMDNVLKLAPIGAFAAMAFSVGHFGLAVLGQLFFLLACFYITLLVFVFVVLGLLLKVSCGISMFQLLYYLRDEILIAVGTSSSESVLAKLIAKMEALGAHPDVVRLVVPTGYSFNLDGTAIYLTMAALFIAQATNVHLSLEQIALLVGFMFITSKGAATVGGGGFIALTATLTAFQIIPVEGVVLIFGIDRFMADGRTFVNLVGNSVAVLFIAGRLGELDKKVLLKNIK
ncbi:MAG: cation:dicarboxylate symporter family transporter [Gammaproteobacteria bacterium]